MIYVFEGRSQNPQQLKKKLLQANQQVKHKELHYSSFLASTEENTKPIKNNIAAIVPETRATSNLNSPLTKGCIKANTTKAMPKLIAPFPSSFKPLNQSIKKIIQQGGKDGRNYRTYRHNCSNAFTIHSNKAIHLKGGKRWRN